MTTALIEFALGLYFIGKSTSIVNKVFSVDIFKLAFGIVLLVLAFYIK